MREIGISPRFSRDKFVPLQTKQRYSTRDISGKVFLTLFFRGFVPFLSLADFVSRDKNLQVADLQRLKSHFEELVTATTSNHQKGLYSVLKSIREDVGNTCERIQEPAEPFLLQDTTAHLAVLPKHIILPNEIMALI